MVGFLPTNHQIPIDGALMKEKARIFAEKLKYLGFKASDGWMERWKKRQEKLNIISLLRPSLTHF